jgi:hypothetical protein
MRRRPSGGALGGAILADSGSGVEAIRSAHPAATARAEDELGSYLLNRRLECAVFGLVTDHIRRPFSDVVPDGLERLPGPAAK